MTPFPQPICITSWWFISPWCSLPCYKAWRKLVGSLKSPKHYKILFPGSIFCSAFPFACWFPIQLFPGIWGCICLLCTITTWKKCVYFWSGLFSISQPVWMTCIALGRGHEGWMTRELKLQICSCEDIARVSLSSTFDFVRRFSILETPFFQQLRLKLAKKLTCS